MVSEAIVKKNLSHVDNQQLELVKNSTKNVLNE